MAYVPNSGSVVAFQGTVPWSVVGNFTGSVIAVQGGTNITSISGVVNTAGSVVAFQGTSPWIVTGSVQGSFSPSGNQSVSGTVGASIIGQLPAGTAAIGSVAILQGTNPLIITGSVQGSFSPSGNQSVSGTVGASAIGSSPVRVEGSVAVAIISGSIAATFTPPANQSVSGVVMAQGLNAPNTSVTGNPVYVGGLNADGSIVGAKAASVLTTPSGPALLIVGSVSGTFSPAANQSVSGTVGASIIGQLPGGTAVLGSVAALQGTNPWIVVSSISGGIFPISGSVAATITNTNVNVSGSVAAWLNSSSASVISVPQGSMAVAIISGSIAATFTPPANQSVSGTVQVDVRNSIAAVIIGGSIATATTNSSVMLLNGGNMIGSVAAYQGSIPWTVVSSITGGIFPISGSVAATITNTNINVSGSVVAFQGTSPWAVAGSVATVIIGGSVATATTNSSVMLLNGGNMVGSVAAYQGSIPWTINSVYGNISGSVAATITNTNINVSGSVVAFTNFQSPSIVGTYAEDAASADGNKGIFTLGVRNDTMASTVSADADYTQFSTDSGGRMLIKPFVADDSAAFRFTGSTVSTSVMLIQASAVGKRSYITDYIVANSGATTTAITFQGGDTSIIAYGIAPTAGGIVATGFNIPPRTTLSQDLAFKPTSASSIIYVTVTGYQAP